MSLASRPASRWAVSARTNGEVLTAGISRSELELTVLGIPGGFSQLEIEGWLHDLAGVAVETSRADSRARAIPALMHHALTGLLFSHAELWDKLEAPRPCSSAFVDLPEGAAFGWVGDARVHDVRNYIRRGKLWEAFAGDGGVTAPGAAANDPGTVLLIDEVDKADIEFPNDLLRELDRMEFYVYETRELVKAKHRPIIVITSNNEKELPDAFLRRCFFHYIRFPDGETMRRIVDVHYPGLKRELLAEALAAFFRLREVPGLRKKPSTSELLDWVKLLVAEDIPPEALRGDDAKKTLPPLYGALLKNEQDMHLVEQVMFLSRRAR